MAEFRPFKLGMDNKLVSARFEAERQALAMTLYQWVTMPSGGCIPGNQVVSLSWRNFLANGA